MRMQIDTTLVLLIITMTGSIFVRILIDNLSTSNNYYDWKHLCEDADRHNLSTSNNYYDWKHLCEDSDRQP